MMSPRLRHEAESPSWGGCTLFSTSCSACKASAARLSTLLRGGGNPPGLEQAKCRADQGGRSPASPRGAKAIAGQGSSRAGRLACKQVYAFQMRGDAALLTAAAAFQSSLVRRLKTLTSTLAAFNHSNWALQGKDHNRIRGNIKV